MAKPKKDYEPKDAKRDKKLGIKEGSKRDEKIDLKKSVMPSSAKLNAGVKAKVVTIKNKKQKGAVASPKITKITKF